MYNICRCCMNVIAVNEVVPLTKTSAYGQMEILRAGEMFEQCFSIKVNELREFQAICISCKAQLTYFSDFKQEVLKAQEKLKKLSVDFGDVKTVDKDTKEENIIDEDTFVVEYLEDGNDNEELIEENTSVELPLENYVEENVAYSIQYLEDDGEDDDGTVTEHDLFDFKEEEENDSQDKEWVLENKSVNKNTRKRCKYSCVPCGRRFRNEITYNAHVNVHQGLPAYICSICNKGFRFKINYEYHMKNHNNNRSFKCTRCGKSFLCRWDLKIHMRVHENLRPYVCDICGKQFRVRSHMTDHLETHNEENNYECHFCKQKYKTKATLKVHMASIHVKAKQYSCNKCGKSFNRQHHLKVHSKVHDKLKNEQKTNTLWS